ncbi:NAD dehydrogenase [Abortiporus biennis]|nr:NAD dehydrogenase [Abortiporus biennis]
MSVRGLKAVLNGTGKYKYKNPESAVDFLVVGGGVVGLAVAQRLAERFPAKSTFLVERHTSAGQETSARNSEVIHGGFYYPADSLKTRLCIRGRQLMYERCSKHSVPHRKLGKLVVAQVNQRPYIEKLQKTASSLQWPPVPGHLNVDEGISERSKPCPVHIISGDEAREMEPDLSKKIVAALWSPETGIVDSHAFMESLEKDILESEGGNLAFSTEVVRVDQYTGSTQRQGDPSAEFPSPGWVVQTVTDHADESDSIFAKTLVNASGLSANLILNSLLPEGHHISMFFARGSYASYHGPGTSNVSHLVYPCPSTGGSHSAFQSLGTHLTLDMNGSVRFGPDLDWLDPPSEDGIDFWQQHLIPDESRLGLMYEAVTEYLPGVVREGFQPDYCGIRPKLVGPNGGFQDFVFRVNYPHEFSQQGIAQSSEGEGQMISLMGIESPGLTASLAIAEMVVDDIVGKNAKIR